MTLLLATNNDHKRRELAQILSDYRVIIPAEVEIEFAFDETGATFLENALGKAHALLKMLRGTTLDASEYVIVADDSGLCVEALAGAPGIYSARYGSPDGGVTELEAEARNALLLKNLDGVAERAAHFVCCMVALSCDDRLAVVQETFEGQIATQASGGGGFGYDPIFLLPERGRCVAELADDEKNRISHRGKAAAGMAVLLGRMNRG